MSHQIRPATSEDLPFLAEIILLAMRSHVNVGAWDLVVPGSEEDRLLAVQAGLNTEEPSWCHHANFLVAEVDGQPAAALSGYPAHADGFLPVERTFITGMEALEFNQDEIGEAFGRMMVFMNCHVPDDEGAWIVEFVACLPKYRRRGLVRELLGEMLDEGRRRGHDFAQLSILLGNDPAIRVYESLGFEIAFEKPDSAFEAAVGAPGMGRMKVDL
jgi:ribosomal protein S18 acetylase RimI-like enzyme